MENQKLTAEAGRRPPFRADHVGSLLRPTGLRESFRAYQARRLSVEEFRLAQDRAIREVAALQEQIGLHAVTDGEFRRASYWAHFVDAVDGLTVKKARYTFRDEREERQEFLAPHVSGRVQRTRAISGQEFDFLRSVTTRTPKLTLPSPPTMHFWRGDETLAGSPYAGREAYFHDLARLYREELADLASRGARYIQIDEVPLAMLCDPQVRETVRQSGVDPEELIDGYIQLINAAISNRPADMTLAMHLCRGNFKGKWLSEGGYEHVAERLFNELDVDAFFLEYDTPRAGDFSPLSGVPPGKTVVLGLVSTKSPELEPVDFLRRRIDEASRFLALEQLAISPQCGFASTVTGNPVTLQDQKNKLRRVVEVARLVWGED